MLASKNIHVPSGELTFKVNCSRLLCRNVKLIICLHVDQILKRRILYLDKYFQIETISRLIQRLAKNLLNQCVVNLPRADNKVPDFK